MSRWTPQREVFCLRYVELSNATEAYSIAYPSTKRSRASTTHEAKRLLRDPAIKARLAELMKQMEDEGIVNARFVLDGLVENFHRAMQHRPVFDREGHETGMYEYEGSVANRSLELLGKHFKMFTEKVEHSGEVSVPITIVRNTPDLSA